MNGYEKIVNIDLEIHKVANTADWERYDAALPIISLRLFQKNLGAWGGRETYLGKSADGFIKTNYWFVLESCVEKAREQIEGIIKNFNLGGFTRLIVGDAVPSEHDFKKELEEAESLEWVWDRD
ncbi:hypothetical protein [Flagellimonas amoyensis]|uniref:hypothetical protein n=1 Tax=Flagellimonas amoyensis TaxID=2169401 RepID=UPI000D3461D9|nr:hypothetical protein [Allomuricauda amoyensis]